MDNAGREVVIRRLLAGKVTVDDAALLLGVSERQVWRLRARYVESGPAALAQGNRRPDTSTRGRGRHHPGLGDGPRGASRVLLSRPAPPSEDNASIC